MAIGEKVSLALLSAAASSAAGLLLGAAFTWALLMAIGWNERQFRRDVVRDVSTRRRLAAWTVLIALTLAGLIAAANG